MVKILHAADFHLDSAFGALTSAQARERRGEMRDLLGRIAQKANEENADLVLLAGDLFDGAALYRETAEVLAESLAEIQGRVFISPGNHDPYGPGSAYAAVDWPENVTIFKYGMIESVELAELNCVVYGAAFKSAAQTESLLRGFAAPDDGRIHVMVLHGDVTNAESGYNPITKEEIARSNLHYLALGHVHQFGGVQKAGKTFYAYPGCPEGRGFDELGEKGVLCGTIDVTGAELRFVPMAYRRYEIITVDITGRDTAQAVEEALGADPEKNIYRLILTGETDENGVESEKLQERFAERCYHLEIRDRTHVSEDIWARAEEDSLCGLFLKELRLKYNAAETDTEREAVELAARFGLAALLKRDW